MNLRLKIRMGIHQIFSADLLSVIEGVSILELQKHALHYWDRIT